MQLAVPLDVGRRLHGGFDVDRVTTIGIERHTRTRSGGIVPLIAPTRRQRRGLGQVVLDRSEHLFSLVGIDRVEVPVLRIQRCRTSSKRPIRRDGPGDVGRDSLVILRAHRRLQRKRELETKLEQSYPDYFSKYSMVTFREDLPYAAAKEKGNAQDRLLMEICANTPDSSQIELSGVMEKIRTIELT